LRTRRDEVTGGWRGLHNELQNLYASKSIIRIMKSRRMRRDGNVARTVRMEKKNAYRLFVGKPGKKKRLLGRPRRKRVDNIKMDLTEIGWSGIEWVDLAQDRDRWWTLVNRVMNIHVLE
jgi:hypothetical protein